MMGIRPGGLLVTDALAEITASPRRALPRASVPVLRQIPLFAELSDRHLRKVAKLATLTNFPANAAVVREGTRGHTFFVILNGHAAVVRQDGSTTTLNAGDYFGEMALLDRKPRSATVTTETKVTALRISATAFQQLLRREPTIALALLQTLSLRVRALERTV
jgi:CRP-like cAMP-binding protein